MPPIVTPLPEVCLFLLSIVCRPFNLQNCYLAAVKKIVENHAPQSPPLLPWPPSPLSTVLPAL
jgi:hypothetical protein